jgi:hypothetical protein
VCGACGTFAHQAYTACLRGQLSSNVRPHRAGIATNRTSASGEARHFQCNTCRVPQKLQAHAEQSIHHSRVSLPANLAATCTAQVRASRICLSPRGRQRQSVVGSAAPRKFLPSVHMAKGSGRSQLQIPGSPTCAALRLRERPRSNTAACAVRPNPSLKLTRYGRLCKPGPRQLYYRRVPGLQSLPPRAA